MNNMDNTNTLKTGSTQSKTDLNTQAVNQIKNAISFEEVTNIMNNTFKKAEEELGRPMTYAEMRERFG
jgi:hypothetical protein